MAIASAAPRHVGIIMDGNGRWARRHGRPHSFGHRAGVRAMKRVMYACEDLGIHILSVYVFSTENWARPRAEVRALMRLFHESIQREFDELNQRGIRILVSGRRDELSQRMQDRIADAEERTAQNPSGVLNVCLNYGGRAEIVDACRSLIASGVPSEVVDERLLASRLYHPDLPDPDLIIRTAGEHRLSNFLLWQAAYAELHVTDTLWPDFDEGDLQRALADYQSRVRRFGGRPEAEAT
jgi:undecaprenyl diphosphate synthase